MDESFRKVSGSLEPAIVTSNEIIGIIKSLKNGKAQDIHALAAEHLKHAVDVISSPLADRMNYILSCGYIPPMILEGLMTPVQKKKIKTRRYQPTTEELLFCLLLERCWRRFSKCVLKIY